MWIILWCTIAWSAWHLWHFHKLIQRGWRGSSDNKFPIRLKADSFQSHSAIIICNLWCCFQSHLFLEDLFSFCNIMNCVSPMPCMYLHRHCESLAKVAHSIHYPCIIIMWDLILKGNLQLFLHQSLHTWNSWMFSF